MFAHNCFGRAQHHQLNAISFSARSATTFRELLVPSLAMFAVASTINSIKCYTRAPFLQLFVYFTRTLSIPMNCLIFARLLASSVLGAPVVVAPHTHTLTRALQRYINNNFNEFLILCNTSLCPVGSFSVRFQSNKHDNLNTNTTAAHTLTPILWPHTALYVLYLVYLVSAVADNLRKSMAAN